MLYENIGTLAHDAIPHRDLASALLGLRKPLGEVVLGRDRDDSASHEPHSRPDATPLVHHAIANPFPRWRPGRAFLGWRPSASATTHTSLIGAAAHLAHGRHGALPAAAGTIVGIVGSIGSVGSDRLYRSLGVGSEALVFVWRYGHGQLHAVGPGGLGHSGAHGHAAIRPFFNV
jgi:hypothetical protein